MSLLYSFVKARIGNRIAWENNEGLYIGEIASVDEIEGELLLCVIKVSDMAGDYWNGGPYLEDELIKVSNELNEKSLTWDGKIKLVAYDDYHVDLLIKPVKHWAPIGR